MTSDESKHFWRRVWDLAERADAVAPEALDAWLSAACCGEAELERTVRAFLQAGKTAQAAATIHEEHPQSVGPYEIEALIGVGGLGRVFRARHRETGREVAIKLLAVEASAEHDRERAGRFRREIQTLARLDHPGIVSIFDAGIDAHAAGGSVRWFAMDLVHGPRTLAEYVRDERPAPERTLELYAEVCEAVANAHESGVLHRDLKPGNLLVDSRGRPRVIDFGIAQVIGAESADLTRTGSLVGTLNYLAPERLDGEHADAASDVYALGLVLEEIVSGRRRYDYSSTASGISALREAQRLPASPVALDAAFPAELDWIIAKATDPTPARRYENARGLADDLRRVLRREPVEARSVGRAHRARLFLLRNRGPVAAAAAIGTLLLAALGATSTTLVRESHARMREQEAKEDIAEALKSERAARAQAQLSAEAAQREEKAGAVLVSFFRGVFERAPARSDDGTPYSIDAALAAAFEQSQVLADSEKDPQIRARALTLVGSAFSRRGLWNEAAELFARADQAYRESGTKETEPGLECTLERHLALLKLGRGEEARAIEDELLGMEDPKATRRLKALNDAFIDYRNIGALTEGRRLLEAIRRDADMADDAQREIALSATHNLAVAIAHSAPKGDETDEPIRLLREVWEYRSEHDPQLDRTYRSARAIGDQLVAEGRFAESLAFLDEAVGLAARNGLGKDRLEIVGLLEVKAKSLSQLGQLSDSVLLLEECLDARRSGHGDRNADVLDTMSLLVQGYRLVGRSAEGLKLAQDGYKLTCEEIGAESREAARFLGECAQLEINQGMFASGLQHADEAYRMVERRFGPVHSQTISTRNSQIYCMAEAGLEGEALTALLELNERCRAARDVPQYLLVWQYDNLCNLLNRQGRHEEAVAAGTEAVGICARMDPPLLAIVPARTHLAIALTSMNRGEEALTQLESAREEAERMQVPGPEPALFERAKSCGK